MRPRRLETTVGRSARLVLLVPMPVNFRSAASSRLGDGFANRALLVQLVVVGVQRLPRPWPLLLLRPRLPRGATPSEALP